MKLKYALLGLLMLLCGCSSQTVIEPSVYEKVQKQLIAMESYRSTAIVEYISNKGSNSYETMQHSKISGEYRVEVTGPQNVAGNITTFDGKTISQFNTRIAGKISIATKENQDRSEIFVTSFIKNYVRSQEVSVSVGSFGQGKCTVLEAIIPGNHPYLATEKLWIDNDTLLPVKLVIYDPDGSERIIVTYANFEYNIPLEDSLFTITEG